MDEEKSGKYISCIHRKVQAYINKELSLYNIGSGQYQFLLKIYKSDGLSQKQLSEDFCIDKATTAKAIKKLIDEQYIVRIDDKFDKRVNRIYITDKGKMLIPIIKNILKHIDNKLNDGFSQEERLKGTLLLKKFFNNASKKLI
ncbi:MAG: transcriptional regulator [Clostridiaceae bacterium]|nr:transcriptional regulator [Clostridiaceae bacterium]